MKNLGYYNGIVKPILELKISALDRAVYFGDGVYEVIYAVNRKMFAFDEHWQRFVTNCELLKINFKYEKNDFKKLINVLLEKEGSFYQKIYWQVSRSTGIRKHDYDEKNSKFNLLIFITDEKIKNMEELKYDLISMEDKRFLYCNIKTLNLIPAVLASQHAKNLNADEAVLHKNELVTECAHSNISIFKNSVLQTAPANNLILPGITRKHLIEICKNLDIKVLEKPFSLNELLNCDEAIVSASGCLFMAAKTLNNVSIGGKNPCFINKIQQTYKNKIIQECGHYLC